MTDALRALAHEAGLAAQWKDAFAKTKHVSDDTLRTVLACLDLPAGTDGEIEASRTKLRDAAELPPLITADPGERLVLGLAAREWTLRLEDGTERAGRTEFDPLGVAVTAPHEPGYHTLALDGRETTLVVAPTRCYALADALSAVGRTGVTRAWGLAAQLYSLRRPGDGGLGDVAALATLARHAAQHGADALSISPVHAQFSADPDRFSPYAPSSRVASNVLHAAIDPGGADAAALEQAALVDWPRAGRLRLAALARDFRDRSPNDHAAFTHWRDRAGEEIELHARFEALHQHFFTSGGHWHWHDWPEAFRDHGTEAVARFAAEHAGDVELHAWMQFRVSEGLAAAQRAAKDAGMAVGIVSDLAVGTDSGGSHCWSRPAETLIGLTVGAPPDLLSHEGQNWGITAFSPHGMRSHGYRAFIEMLRAALRHAGGVRIDHAMGLNRLWVVPQGETSARGVYLSMPERDLLRLVRLESQRHRAIVLGEDLGTVPEGFTDRLGDAGIDGMRVMWFERDEQRFHAPRTWSRPASAMTSTHDLPTASGWWRGRDIDWNERLGRPTDGAREERARDRALLWEAMRESGAATGEAPNDWDGYRVVDAAVGHVARAGCELVMLPLEDALALEEAPNVPGTTDEHPNWRRRLPGDSATLLDEPHVKERLLVLDRARHAS